jgi:hypothetical protein
VPYNITFLEMVPGILSDFSHREHSAASRNKKEHGLP